MFEKSLPGARLCSRSGIEELMEDLGHAMAEAHGKVRMLGGGNPAFIPEMEAVWQERMRALLADGPAFNRMLGAYDPPKGNSRFALALASLLQREFGWPVGAEHIAITNGGQTAFFYLFNMLAGEFSGGRRKQILLPQMPEYIGYANQGAAPDLFRAVEPIIEFRGAHRFKYRVDFDKLSIDETVGAICVSRPANPSGNVLTDTEIRQLNALATEAGVPLIVDNAYGLPFPGIIFREVTPIWNENIVLTLSLSKLGLPGVRTGIVIAHPEIIRAISSMNAVIGLSNGTVGQALTLPLVESGEILRLARQVVRPFYERKSQLAQAWIAKFFDNGLDYHVHECEGALFLWLWFRGLPISASALYERLKRRGVLIVPGNYFSYGSAHEWQHATECIRVSFAMDEETVREGIRLIAEEVREAYGERKD